ncbi:MAG: M20/M25/M40 family metallo-hydrolase [Chloroflexales bacterium]|nr:M20/M25/M40 family metallo-hydrolase [Chloroflexales bacterium]
MTTTVESYLQSNAGEAQALLERLCRQTSVAAQGLGIAEMAALAAGLLQDNGFAVRYLEAEGAPPAVYGELKGRSPYTLLLYNHYDVQPDEPLDLWHSPPFDPTVRDGKLFARGSSDNKGEIAARLTAIRALRAAHGELPITIRWIIEGEEEIGSPHFAAIAEPYADLLRADGALWEGSSFGPDGRPQLVLGTKGLLYVQYDVQCLSGDAHSGGAPTLPSAAWLLVRALASLRDERDGTVLIPGFYDAMRQPTAADLAALADQPDMDAQLLEQYGIERFNDGLTGAALRQRQAFAPTCNIAGISTGYGGEGVKTVLPARASAKMDFRLVPDQDPHAIAASLQAHLAQEGFADVQVRVLGAAEPVATPLDDPFVQRIAAIAESFEGQKPTVAPLIGGTLPLLGALRRFVGVPGLCAPGNPVYWANGAHAPNEHIRLEDLERAVHFNCHMLAALGR